MRWWADSTPDVGGIAPTPPRPSRLQSLAQSQLISATGSYMPPVSSYAPRTDPLQTQRAILCNSRSSLESVTAPTTAPLTSAVEGRLPPLLILVAASGCAALVYEVVWYQLLPLAIGSTSVSLGILLAAFMGGLCIGSLWLPRALPQRHPLEIYAALELGIGACAILVQFGLPFLDRVYIAGAEHGLPGMLLRATLAGICLLPPTILMGASFPVIIRWVERSRPHVNWWGFLYGANTAGAVLGCLLAGFYLLRIYDMATATYVAAAINLIVAAASLALARAMPYAAPIPPPFEPVSPGASGSRWPIYATIGRAS